MKIGDKTIKRSVGLIEEAFYDYLSKLNEAFVRCNKKLDVNFKVTIEPANNGNNLIVKISFVADKVDDNDYTGVVTDEEQMTLFDYEPEDNSCAPLLGAWCNPNLCIGWIGGWV